MKKKILEFQNLSISFQKNQQVVNNLSFSLYEKETLALVGESGSGKSVTALASMKLLPSNAKTCLLYTSPSPRDGFTSRMPSSA